MIRSIFKVSMMLFSALVMVSCISNHTATVVDTPPMDWSESVGLLFENKDSVSKVDVNLIVYYTVEAPDSALLAVRVTSPDGYRAEDTVMCYLPKRRSMDYCEREIPYRRATVLRHTGDYKIEFTPLDTLDGVWAVGVNTVTAN